MQTYESYSYKVMSLFILIKFFLLSFLLFLLKLVGTFDMRLLKAAGDWLEQGQVVTFCSDNSLYLWEISIRDSVSYLEEVRALPLENKSVT